MRPPTPRQLEVLRFIADQRAARGCAPTIREIGAALGISSTNAVKCHLRALERRSLVRSEPLRARTLRLTKAGRLLVPRNTPNTPEAA